MPRSRKDAEAVADKLGLTGDDREEYVVRLSGEAAAPAAPAPKPAAPPQPPYLIPDGGFDGVAPERKAPTRPAIKAPAPAPAPVVIPPDDVSSLAPDTYFRTVVVPISNEELGESRVPMPTEDRTIPAMARRAATRVGEAVEPAVEWMSRPGAAAVFSPSGPTKRDPLLYGPEPPPDYTTLVDETAALPSPATPDARRQVVADTLGLPGAKVYREQPAAPRAAPVDAFRADYEFLVSQGYPQAQLDQFIAEKGAAELSKVAASKRGGK